MQDQEQEQVYCNFGKMGCQMGLERITFALVQSVHGAIIRKISIPRGSLLHAVSTAGIGLPPVEKYRKIPFLFRRTN